MTIIWGLKMARRKSKFRRIREKYSIIVDGKCEKWYFQLLKKHENLQSVDIVPELPSRRKLKDVFSLVVGKIKEGYDKVIWVLDFDVLVKEDGETRKRGKKGKIQEFKECVDRLRKHKNVFVLVNTPCLEFWYLLHFRRTGRYFGNCDKVIKCLKKVELLSDYEKSERYYKKASSDIYEKLKPFQNAAIKNAESLGDFDFNDCQRAKAEIYKVFEIIGVSTERNRV